MKNFFFIWKFFYENHPPTRHIKYKTIDFAPCNKSIVAKKCLSTNRALIVPNWSKWPIWQSLNPHNFTKNDHR